ncbi:SAM-dependent methyltransferase [Ornithinimicrobium sp. INDO-MA30-4]|uniref:SAM-dependent methyltransferase n=1 Tax=Ornithinimicrobium sp. INDO-MA30-4 TaxID=2908651 RepID=UPI001F4828ED|nr:SAM-dependent methyltransferase [Ornithinimicrobium sp. INDO-MA30-4]UJH70978.1 hypothetical protein L0A91_03260 [Ornithinimicrobium sp. INDO-MA30-4]
MASLVTSDADLLLLAKPQFEVGPDRVGRNGIVRSHEARRDALLAVTRSIYTSGLAIKDIMPSVITGGGGNREYVVWAKPEQPGLWDEDTARDNVQEIIRRSTNDSQDPARLAPWPSGSSGVDRRVHRATRPTRHRG